MQGGAHDTYNPQIVTSSETEQFTFEAAVLLALLANFHKSEAARLNPHLKCMRESQDERLMRKICWASNFAADAVVKCVRTVCERSVSINPKAGHTKISPTTRRPR